MTNSEKLSFIATVFKWIYLFNSLNDAVKES